MVSPGQRCDEILRILDDALSGVSELPARGSRAGQPGEGDDPKPSGARYRRGQPTHTGSSGGKVLLG